MQLHGLIKPLCQLILKADTVSMPCPTSERHTHICNEVLTELYSMLNSHLIVDDIKSILVIPGKSSDFTYHQLLNAIQGSTAHIGRFDTKPTLTVLLQGPLKNELLSFINQCCTSNKEINLQLCTEHSEIVGNIFSFSLTPSLSFSLIHTALHYIYPVNLLTLLMMAESLQKKLTKPIIINQNLNPSPGLRHLHTL